MQHSSCDSKALSLNTHTNWLHAVSGCVKKKTIPYATLSSPEWFARRWAAVEVALVFHGLWVDKVTIRQCPWTKTWERSVHEPKLERGEPQCSRLSRGHSTTRSNRLTQLTQPCLSLSNYENHEKKKGMCAGSAKDLVGSKKNNVEKLYFCTDRHQNLDWKCNRHT